MNKPTPPIWSKKFLQWYCKDSLHESIMGDLEEQFDEDVEKHGRKKAKRRFTWNVIRFCRSGIISSPLSNHILNNSMISHHFTSSTRYLAKHKSFTIINVLGLAVGMAAALLIYQYVDHESNFDSFHQDSENIYRVTAEWNPTKTPDDKRATSVYWAGPGVMEAFPEVVNFTQLSPLSTRVGPSWINYQDLTLGGQEVYLADTNFFEVFSYGMVKGSAETAMVEPFSMVITESMSKKLFKDEEALGKIVNLNSNDNIKENTNGKSNFIVTGIVKDPPSNSHLQFDALISKNSAWDFNTGSMYWHWDFLYTYLQVEPSADTELLATKMTNLRTTLFGEEFRMWNDRIDFHLQPLSNIHINSTLSGEPTQTTDRNNISLLNIVMFCILASAYINYINLATVKSIERKKETGVRKIMGSSKSQLVVQLLVESCMLNFMAIVLAVFIAMGSTFILESLIGLSWPVSMSMVIDMELLFLILAVLASGIILSSLYPAVLVLSIKSKEAVKGFISGSQKGGTQWLLRKSLIVFQFGFGLAFLIITFVVQGQLSHMKNKDLGFNPTQVAVIPALATSNFEDYQLFKTNALSLNNVSSIAFSSASPGDQINELGLKHRIFNDGNPIGEMKILSIDENFFETMQIDLVSGRDFDFGRKADADAILLNEAAASMMGWRDSEEAEGEIFDLSDGSGKRKVIGVVKNYHQLGLRKTIEPLVFVPAWSWNRTWMDQNILVKLTEVDKIENLQSTFDALENSWRSTMSDAPFNLMFLDDHFERQYQYEHSFSRLFMFFSGLSIFISCLGLFGLVAYTTLQRTKEIGIRKVLGAGISSILSLISKEFVALLVISSLIVMPVSWLLAKEWLNQYAFRMELGVWLFIIPGFIVAVLSLSIVILQSIKVAAANPVDSLRDE